MLGSLTPLQKCTFMQHLAQPQRADCPSIRLNRRHANGARLQHCRLSQQIGCRQCPPGMQATVRLPDTSKVISSGGVNRQGLLTGSNCKRGVLCSQGPFDRASMEDFVLLVDATICKVGASRQSGSDFRRSQVDRKRPIPKLAFAKAPRNLHSLGMS